MMESELSRQDIPSSENDPLKQSSPVPTKHAKPPTRFRSWLSSVHQKSALRYRRFRNVWDSCSWRWEIVSCVLILTWLLAIFATLYPYDGQPLPQLPFKISINSLLSIYSMLLKASMAVVIAACIGQLQWSWFSQERPVHDFVRYDNARQGPWGSLQLLWEQRLRQPQAALGGLLLILSIGIDPFIQQLVGHYDCSVVVNDERATLPRTNRIDNPFEMFRSNRDVRSAFSQGIAGLGNGLLPGCATGNCSFNNPYGTIGFCSFCEDTSDEIAIDTSYVPINDSLDDPAMDGIMTIKSSLPEGNYWGTSLPTPGQLSRMNVTYSVKVSNSSACEKYSEQVPEVAKMDVYDDGSNDIGITVKVLAGKTTFSDKHIDITTGGVIAGCENGTSTTTASGGTWRCRGYGAATCTVQPCVRVYNATMEAGRFTERLIAQSGGLAWADAPLGSAIIDTDCLTPEDRSKLRNQGYKVGESSRWLTYAAADVKSPWAREMTESLLAQKCLYSTDSYLKSDFGRLTMGDNFIATLIADRWQCVTNSNFSIPDFKGLDIIKHIYNLGDIDLDRIQETFSNISEVLTTYVRTNGDENYSEPAVGDVYHYATCIRIQWGWIAFPSSLAILAILLFVWIASSKALRHFPVWKASPLPWLMYGHKILGTSSEGGDKLHETPHTIDEIEKRSKDISATWVFSPSPHIQMSAIHFHEGIAPDRVEVKMEGRIPK
ncbi:hypothetical protein F5Y04DRAFT_156128 [Hypomontagnella monticulosa]|nr:hypothetical protein F5Y04DRAFT_156128 [Hypomontagnella monticulosa]